MRVYYTIIQYLKYFNVIRLWPSTNVLNELVLKTALRFAGLFKQSLLPAVFLYYNHFVVVYAVKCLRRRPFAGRVHCTALRSNNIDSECIPAPSPLPLEFWTTAYPQVHLLCYAIVLRSVLPNNACENRPDSTPLLPSITVGYIILEKDVYCVWYFYFYFLRY